MLKIKSHKKNYDVEFSSKDYSEGKINGKNFLLNIINSFHIIKNDKCYSAEIIKVDFKNKTYSVKVNGNIYHFQVSDRYDILLKEMGFDVAVAEKIKNIRAPMPGLVLDIRVAEKQTVQTGEPLIVLEAMKMENVLKSPADGIVKRINVKKRDAVEKNAVLIEFE